MYDTGNPSTGWYYWSLNDRSYSWAGVQQFHSFVTNNTTYGPGGYSVTWNTGYTSWSTGDIMQFYSGSEWIHSTVITGFIYYENGTTIPLVTGRTGDNRYNLNDDARDVWSGNAKRILHLYNYGA